MTVVMQLTAFTQGLEELRLLPDAGKIEIVFQQVADRELKKVTGLYGSSMVDEAKVTPAHAADTHALFRAGLGDSGILWTTGDAYFNGEALLDEIEIVE